MHLMDYCELVSIVGCVIWRISATKLRFSRFFLQKWKYVHEKVCISDLIVACIFHYCCSSAKSMLWILWLRFWVSVETFQGTFSDTNSSCTLYHACPVYSALIVDLYNIHCVQKWSIPDVSLDLVCMKIRLPKCISYVYHIVLWLAFH